MPTICCGFEGLEDVDKDKSYPLLGVLIHRLRGSYPQVRGVFHGIIHKVVESDVPQKLFVIAL